MGRPRTFDTESVLDAARDTFVGRGYPGTSMDDLLRATGLQRASLYSAFGSKRELFLTILRRGTASGAEDLDLLLVTLMDLAPSDEEARRRAQQGVDRLGPHGPEALGARLLARARLLPSDQNGQQR